jgi:hypothetical protein
MQSKAKSNSVITHALGADGMLTFTVLGAGSFTVDPARLSDAMRQRAAIHGIIQRVSDGGAMSRNPDTGQPATPADKMARMQAIADHLQGGGDEWAMRAAGGAKGPDAGLTIMGMIRSGLAADVDAANGLIERLAAKREIDRTAALKVWADSDRVAKAIAEIRAERAKGNAADLLAELADE